MEHTILVNKSISVEISNRNLILMLERQFKDQFGDYKLNEKDELIKYQQVIWGGYMYATVKKGDIPKDLRLSIEAKLIAIKNLKLAYANEMRKKDFV